MASPSSSSTPSSQPQKKHDVFISFRGEDTRFNFTSHLHEALRSKHIDTYIDYRLEKGDGVWPSLEAAIQDSILFLVIFSDNYASSTWCLKELAKIVGCSKNQGHLVMPVFYRVDPAHVRKQSGSYQKAFEEHELKGINTQQLKAWREALTHAANLSGWHCSFNSIEAELIKEIVNGVIQKLSSKYQSENYLKDLIGIHGRMADVESLLDKGSYDDVRFIGIWGMGGIGKTTLAKALFTTLRFAYDGSYFLDNVREQSKKCGIADLRKKLVFTLLGDKESHIGMLDDSISPYAMIRLGRKKVFIVLDDVDDNEQLENLARRDQFGPGSKILITTRDKQVLGKEVDDIYVLKALNPDQSFDLFSTNAFRNGNADPKIRGLAEKVTQYAEGNPLALKVLGSQLYGKNQEAWESQLEKLQKLPCPKINDILRLSIQGLDDEEKNIFLDIACFFNYYNVNAVEILLDACGYSTIIGLERLEDKALLDKNEGRISMHHLIKEIGRQIVREESLKDPKMRSRLWNSNEILEILNGNMGSEAIEGIILKASEVLEEMCLSPQAFCSMPNLKFLIFLKDKQFFLRNFNQRQKLKFPRGIEFLPKKLRLLYWVGYPSESLPATFKAEYIVQIQMPYSKLTKLWDGEQDLVNLREIDLSESKELIELPDFSKAKHLTEVELNQCSKLRSVHPSLLSLHSLRHLWLRDCKALTSLTSNTHLKSLVDLGLGGCSRLSKFSVTSENHQLKLDLSETAINDELCSSSGCLGKIYSLSMYGCKSVTSLHKLLDLRYLTCLNAACCNKLASNLGSLFEETRTLEVLRLRDCDESFEVPENIRLLSSLYELDLCRTNIKTLPSSIKHLLCLQELYLNGCKMLLFLPELPPSISSISAGNCTSLETLHFPHIHNCHAPPYAYFIFTNCMKLDQESINSVEEKVVVEIDKAIHENAHIEYSGERVPKWFMYRSTTQSLVTVDLDSIPQPWDKGIFIFCAVISTSPVGTRIAAKWLIDGQYAFKAGTSCLVHESTLGDHVFIWHYPDSCEKVQMGVEEMRKESQRNTTYHPLLQIQFTVDHECENARVGEIIECGACLTSALKHQSDTKQIQLFPSSIATECPSRKRKYHILLLEAMSKSVSYSRFG